MSKPAYRQLWMFPRNLRRIEPWKLVQIAKLLTSNDGDITDQAVQNALYDQLTLLVSKMQTNRYGVANSGGMRTYLAQLACLGFFWKDPVTGAYVPTRAGELLINADNPVKLLRCQLLRMQYPSVYGLGPNVRIAPTMRVKPFVFLVRLLREERLGKHLSDLEVAIPVAYGRTNDDYERCVAKILELRSGKNLRDVIDSFDDLRTPKRYKDQDDENGWRKGLKDLREIANTGTNYLRAAQLLVPSLDVVGHFELNADPAVLDEIEPWLKESIEPLNPNTPEAWQQRFGRFDQQKAVRRHGSTQRTNGFESLVQTRYISALSADPFGLDEAHFIDEEAKRWGRPSAEIRIILDPILSRRRTIERDVVVQATTSGGKEAIVLEKAATSIFRRLGFDLAEHIGQRVAPRRGGYPDVLLRATNWDHCAFVDTKATSRYDFPINDTSKLESYYKDAWKEFPDPVEASFFVYIAGGFNRSLGTIEKKLRECSNLYGRPVNAITTAALLDLSESAPAPSVSEIVSAFSKGKLFTSASEFRPTA